MEDAKTFRHHARRAFCAAGVGALIAAASLVGFPTKAADTDVMEKKREPKPIRWVSICRTRAIATCSLPPSEAAPTLLSHSSERFPGR